MPKHEIDCRNLKCPMPIVQVALRLRQMAIGDQLEVRASDPAFLADMHAWARMTGQRLGDIVDGTTKQLTVTKVAEIAR